jgi:hypothetical protein
VPRGPRSKKVGVRLRQHLERFIGERKDSDACNDLDISVRSLSRLMGGGERRVSHRVLQQLARVMNVPVEHLIENDTEIKVPSRAGNSETGNDSPTSVRRRIGQALLADARGDHKRAADILLTLTTQQLDGAALAGYRIGLARAAAGLEETERAEQLLRDNLASLKAQTSSPLLLARNAFELAIILARREKIFDAIDAFVLAEHTLEGCGESALHYLFFVRQHFLSLALRIGHRSHAVRLLRISLTISKAIEDDSVVGLWALDEPLLEALASAP